MAAKAHTHWTYGPPVFRRLTRNGLAASVIAAMLAIALVVLRDPLGIPREPWGRYGPLFFGLMPCIVFLPMLFRARRRIRTLFRQADGRRCTHCAYIVGPLGDRGTCPECGEPFDAAADELTWKASGFER